MSLKETYFGNLGNVKKMDPDAVIVDVTRRAGSVLSPSWDLLNEYKAGKMTWDGYISRFMREMDNPECRVEMLWIGNLAMTKEVYLVCFERVGNCHRFLLVDIINELVPTVVGSRSCPFCEGVGKWINDIFHCNNPVCGRFDAGLVI